ncbi:MAG: DUF3551 domain-containing protein [Rhodoplanes sp.]|uniref:DUF3551 domain-containing protein n=1 Tax=Rhodoplanes sp. TaxID=1968906 RepID=UPI0017B3535E|nr:DUF3551 domain-containing protein [Rhodoplanes sp.]NVO17614.1 DUF3551 domain-containing protein [Rhodoplanes sp.]
MRRWLIALGLVAAAFAADMRQNRAEAYPIYPWCAQYGGGRGGGSNCYFANLWQCRQAISGNGGTCYENPFYWAYGSDSERPVAPARKSKQRTQ